MNVCTLWNLKSETERYHSLRDYFQLFCVQKHGISNVLSHDTSWPIPCLCYQVLFGALSSLQLFHVPAGAFFFLRFLCGGPPGGSGVRGSLLSDCRRTAAWTMPSENQMKRSSHLNSELPRKSCHLPHCAEPPDLPGLQLRGKCIG